MIKIKKKKISICIMITKNIERWDTGILCLNNILSCPYKAEYKDFSKRKNSTQVFELNPKMICTLFFAAVT